MHWVFNKTCRVILLIQLQGSFTETQGIPKGSRDELGLFWISWKNVGILVSRTFLLKEESIGFATFLGDPWNPCPPSKDLDLRNGV